MAPIFIEHKYFLDFPTSGIFLMLEIFLGHSLCPDTRGYHLQRFPPRSILLHGLASGRGGDSSEGLMSASATRGKAKVINMPNPL